MDTAPISDFFDRETCCHTGEPPEGGVAGVSSVLLEALERTGIDGTTVFEGGCGTGALSVEMLIRGAARVTGVDLSGNSIELARRRAAAHGRADRAEFRAGDAATAQVAPHDVVVSDKVLCCYPDATGFLENTLPAARTLYAFSVPSSSGLRGVFSRLMVGFENGWRRIRGDRFRAYVHDVGRIDARVREAGFEPVLTRKHWVWHVAVYRRDRSA